MLDEDVNDSWDWRDMNGKDMTTPVMNQHIPKYCGACYAFGTLSALSDRIKISRQARWPEVNLSPQVILNCGKKRGYDVSCNGGYAHATYSYAHRFGFTDVTCAAYQAEDLPCSSKNVCRNCAHNGTCFSVKNPTKYFVSEYGQISGEKNMQKEIQQRGPIACGIAANKAFLHYNGGVFHDTTNFTSINHVISLVGWGSDGASNYWIGRNSWGSYYGENGFFRIIRGINNLNVESDCYWAVPKFDDALMQKGMATRTDTSEESDLESTDDDSEFDLTKMMAMDDMDITADTAAATASQ